MSIPPSSLRDATPQAYGEGQMSIPPSVSNETATPQAYGLGGQTFRIYVLRYKGSI